MRIMHNQREGVGCAMARSDIATITSILDICGQTALRSPVVPCHRFAGNQFDGHQRSGGRGCVWIEWGRVRTVRCIVLWANSLVAGASGKGRTDRRKQEAGVLCPYCHYYLSRRREICEPTVIICPGVDSARQAFTKQ